jgi:NhaA family Na+:H+ antiporter
MKSERNAAVVMMGAAMAGLLIANSPFGQPLLDVVAFKVHFDFLNIHITLGHIVSDFFLALFFFIAGLELKYEMRLGTLSSASKALVPVLAAIAGIIFPAAIYLYFNWGQATVSGWPIPTATDIAFALGILALFGRGMPVQARIFLLALAIFDDLVAITIIAIAYTADLQTGWLIATLVAAAAFRFAEKSRISNKWLVRVSFGLIIWYTVYQSGVHATIAGVILGLLIPATRTHSVMSKIQPTSNFFVLPLFAFTAVAVVFPSLEGSSNPVFSGTLYGLAVGKVLGIAVVGYLANHFLGGKDKLPIKFVDFAALGFLGGVGFTVSLLMSQLAFRTQPELYAQATLGVMLGSFASMGCAGVLLTLRSKHYLNLKRLEKKTKTTPSAKKPRSKNQSEK